jgi:hypothetical protein
MITVSIHTSDSRISCARGDTNKSLNDKNSIGSGGAGWTAQEASAFETKTDSRKRGLNSKT